MKQLEWSKGIFAILVALQFAALTWLATQGEIPIPTLWIGYGVAFGSYLLLATILRGKRIPVVVLFLVAVGLRIPWIPAGLSLSDDAWRYLHDGRAQVAGVNPYRYPPSAPQAAEYAGAEHDLINNQNLPTIYPPAAQLAFRGAVHFGGTLVSWKLLVLLADLGVGLGLVVLLANRGKSTTLAGLYLFHPLPIIEFVGNGHLDVLGICAFVFSLAVASQRSWVSGMTLAISGATKYLTFPLVPFYLRDHRKRVGGFVIGFVTSLALLYIPFLDYPPIGSLGVFARTFEFNGPIYLLAKTVAGQTGARLVLGTVLLVLLVWAWVQQYDVERAALLWIGGVLLVSPIVHPWYVTWLIPFLVLRTEWWVMVWTGTVILAYYVLTDWRAEGVWYLPWVVMVLEYVPVYILLLFRLRGPISLRTID